MNSVCGIATRSVVVRLPSPRSASSTILLSSNEM
jgi:hypothetical protein